MKKYVLTFWILLLIIASNAAAQDKPIHEVYSMMVYNFVKYIQWPHAGSNEFVITVLGNDEMFETMNKWYTGSKLGNLTCVVRQYKSSSDLATSQVVFIDKSKSNDFGAIHSEIRTNSTLIITDKNGLGQRDSDINFKVVDGKLKFEMNQKSIADSNLKVASTLSSMAILI